MICENSFEYHSESDSGSDSNSESPSMKAEVSGVIAAVLVRFSEEFLKGWSREGDMEISLNGELGRGLCFVITKG